MFFRKIAFICIVVFVIFFTNVGWSKSLQRVSVATAGHTQTVRVAFYPMPGFHQTHPVTGEPVGYDVDYLNRISQYTRWKIKYVPANTWEAALQALENGEADLVGAAQVSRDRLDRFIFTADAMGRSRSVMVTLRTNTDLVFEDFAAFDLLRVGVVKTWIRRNDFLEYAQNHNFRPVVREFASTTHMRDALQTGDIDAMAMDILEMEAAEKRLAEFLPAPFFYIMRKNDTALKQKLDEALGQVRISNASLDASLMKKWYPRLNKTPYSKAELDYIQSNPEITMSLLVNRPPFSHLHDDALRFEGIVPAVLRLISKDSGLRFVLSPLAQEGTPLELVAEGKVRAVGGVARFDAQLRDPRVVVTDSFFTSPLVLMGRAERAFSATSSSIVAMPKDFLGGKHYINQAFPNFTVLEVMGNGRSCLEVLRNKRADYALVSSLGIVSHLNSPRYANIHAVPGVSVAEQLALLLPADTDPLLLSILNKSIRRLDDGEIQRITANYSLSHPYQLTLADFFLQYHVPILVIVPLLGFGLMLFLARMMVHTRTWSVNTTSEATLKSIANTITGGVITLNPADECAITYANAGFWALVGFPEDTDLVTDRHRFTCFLHSDDVESFVEALRENAQRGTPLRLELRLCHSSGTILPVLLRGTAGIDTHGTPLMYCVLVDITEQRAIVERLEFEKERFRILVEQSNDILFEYDAENQILRCSPRFRLTYGRTPQPGGLRELQLPPDDEACLLDLMDKTILSRENAVARVRIADATGRWLWSRIYLACIVRADKLVRVVGRIENIDPEVQEMHRLEALSQRDPLSGLLNRTAFQAAVESCLAELDNGSSSTLFFIDLDNFKAVNDNFGHAAGDKALIDVASTLTAFFRTADLISRYGGDEFCVFVFGIPHEVAIQKATGLVNRLRRTYGAESSTPVEVSASMGVAFYPDEAADYEELVRAADAAAYRAKVLGKGQFVLYGDIARDTCTDC